MAQDRASERPATRFEAEVTCVAGTSVLWLRGDVDHAFDQELQTAVDAAIRSGGRLTIDMSGVTYMDSVGLAAILCAHHDLGRLREAIVIRSAPESVRRLLRMTEIDRLVTDGDQHHGALVEPVVPPPGGFPATLTADVSALGRWRSSSRSELAP